MTAFETFWNGLDFTPLVEILLRVIPAFICITFHELSHGAVAYRLGDDTAKRAGRLTLNPIKHIDPVGLIMMIAFRFGWAKPVPVDMRRFKNPKRGMALTSLAGPVSNVVLSALVLFVFGLVYWPLSKAGTAFAATVRDSIYYLAQLSIYFAIFNIIPIPPLDGSKVLFSLLPDRSFVRLMRYERYGMILLIVVAVTGVLGNTLGSVSFYVFEKLYNVFAYVGFRLYELLA